MPDRTIFTASQYESICASLPDPTFILTQSGRYAAILGGKDKRYYHDGSSLVGRYLSQVLVPTKAEWFLLQIAATLAQQHMRVLEYQLSGHDVLGLPVEGPAEPIWFEGRVSALQEHYDGEPAVVWVASNITDSKRWQQQLQRQALTDELTGLPNRRRFMQALHQAFTAFVVSGQSPCLISFDVDHFKAINDGLGHPAGDLALCDLAQLVQGMVGPDDLVCRLGGDEFAILCAPQPLEQLRALAQQLLTGAWLCLQPYATAHAQPALSMGLAHFMPHDGSVEGIMRRVDQALYLSKHQGGHQYSELGSCAAAARTASV